MSENSSSERTNSDERLIQKGRFWGILVVLLSLLGVVVSVYLYYLHLSLMIGDIRGTALCGAENGLGCHAVAMSRYSTLLEIPLPVWGGIYFLTTAILGVGGVIFRAGPRWAVYRLAFYIASMGLLFDGYLAFVMIKKIQVVCQLCVATYGINAGIFLVLFGASRKPAGVALSLHLILPKIRLAHDHHNRDYYENMLKYVFFGIILCIIFFSILGSEITKHAVTANYNDVAEKYKKSLLDQQPRTINIDKRPFLGSGNARLTIVEFSDFRCPFCRRGAKYLRIVSTDYQKDADIVFKHFPLDRDCNPMIQRTLHPGACKLAEGAVCADLQGKFWEFHDMAFQSQGSVSDALLSDIAQKIGLNIDQFYECLSSTKAKEVIRQDIDEALALGVRQTPMLFINGRGLNGVPRPWILRKIINFARENAF